MNAKLAAAVAVITLIFLLSCASTGAGSGDSVSLTEAIDQSAGKIAAEIPPGTRIAVLVFETESVNLSAFIIEELAGALIDRKIEVVNRRSIEYVERELNFQMSGAVSDESAKSVGQFLGADIVIIGQLRHLGSTYRFTINAIHVESASSASVPRFTIRNDRELQGMIAALDRQTLAASVPNTLIQQAAPQTAGTFLDRGIMFAMRGEYDMAVTDFTEALRLNPNLVGAYILRGRALVASMSKVIGVADNFSGVVIAGLAGRVSAEQSRVFERAIADFTDAIRLDPGSSAAYRERGRVHGERGDYDRAIADYNQAIRLNPHDERAYINRGNAYNDGKREYDRAIADFEAALRINPNYALAYNGRGIAYYNKKDYDRAIADYNQAIRLDPNFATAYYNRGNAYYNKKDYDRAIADYTQAIRLDPNFASAYNNRGLAYDNKKDYDRAIADYTQAIRLDPNYAVAYYNRGLAYYNKKDYDRAIADYNQAVRLDPNYADAYYNRGSAYYMKQDYNRAIADYEAALRIDPNHANAREWLENARKARGR